MAEPSINHAMCDYEDKVMFASELLLFRPGREKSFALIYVQM